jgi:hypothetical protein
MALYCSSCVARGSSPTLIGEHALTFGGQIFVLFAVRTYLPQSFVNVSRCPTVAVSCRLKSTHIQELVRRFHSVSNNERISVFVSEMFRTT